MEYTDFNTGYRSDNAAIEDNKRNITNMFVTAIENDNIKMLDFLLTKEFKIPSTKEYCPVRHAAEKGHLNVIKWLYWHGWCFPEYYPDALILANKNGNTHIQEWVDNALNKLKKEGRTDAFNKTGDKSC